MEIDLGTVDDEDADGMVLQLLIQLQDARSGIERLERRAAGIRKMIDGLVEMYPAAEDLLPDDYDNEEKPRPRGAEAVRRVLADNAGEWYGVPAVAQLLESRGWSPNSSNPANAVRTALTRLTERKEIEKARSALGAVIYRLPKAASATPPAYDYGEEPF